MSSAKNKLRKIYKQIKYRFYKIFNCCHHKNDEPYMEIIHLTHLETKYPNIIKPTFKNPKPVSIINPPPQKPSHDFPKMHPTSLEYWSPLCHHEAYINKKSNHKKNLNNNQPNVDNQPNVVRPLDNRYFKLDTF